MLFIIVFLSSNVYADSNQYQDIVETIETLCKAPTSKKSSYYKVSSKGKVNIRIKILALANGEADFKLEEWEGVQRVLREHQVDDNKQYRECSIKLTPIFLEKFYISKEKDKKESENRDRVYQSSGQGGININGSRNIHINTDK